MAFYTVGRFIFVGFCKNKQHILIRIFLITDFSIILFSCMSLLQALELPMSYCILDYRKQNEPNFWMFILAEPRALSAVPPSSTGTIILHSLYRVFKILSFSSHSSNLIQNMLTRKFLICWGLKIQPSQQYAQMS